MLGEHITFALKVREMLEKFKRGQNLSNDVKKSSKVQEDKKTLISDFTAIDL